MRCDGRFSPGCKGGAVFTLGIWHRWECKGELCSQLCLHHKQKRYFSGHHVGILSTWPTRIFVTSLWIFQWLGQMAKYLFKQCLINTPVCQMLNIIIKIFLLLATVPFDGNFKPGKLVLEDWGRCMYLSNADNILTKVLSQQTMHRFVQFVFLIKVHNPNTVFGDSDCYPGTD